MKRSPSSAFGICTWDLKQFQYFFGKFECFGGLNIVGKSESSVGFNFEGLDQVTVLDQVST